MALKIRLRQQGRKSAHFYRIVLTDARAPRGGKYLEALGWYNPIEAEDDKKLEIKVDRIQYWLNLGAQLTDNAASLVKRSAPHVLHEQTQKQLALREKISAKRKAKKQAQP